MSASDPGGVPTLDVQTLRSRLDRGEPLTVLDVRPAAERAEWSIPGSLHRDAYDALRRGDSSALADLALPPDRPVVAVCARGRTSRIAAELLRRRGLEAYSLEGGMKAWSLAWNAAEIAGPRARLVQLRRTGKG
jgi:rhodanese-related sulfurtransferase